MVYSALRDFLMTDHPIVETRRAPTARANGKKLTCPRLKNRPGRRRTRPVLLLWVTTVFARFPGPQPSTDSFQFRHHAFLTIHSTYDLGLPILKMCAPGLRQERLMCVQKQL